MYYSLAIGAGISMRDARILMTPGELFDILHAMRGEDSGRTDS